MFAQISASTKKAARLVIFVLTLTMLVIAASAPECIGPIIH